jgi:hypothetical protein
VVAPTLLLQDSFTRANESPLSGGGRWTVGGLDNAATGVKIVSNAVVRQLASGSFGRDNSYMNAVVFGAGQSCQVGATVATMSSDGVLDLFLFEVSTRNGYRLSVQAAPSFGAHPFILQRTAAGSDSALGFTDTPTPTSGDQVALQIDGNDIVAWHFRAGTWTELLRVTDTTYRPAFKPGMAIAGFNDTTAMVVDDFSANLADPGGLNRPLRIPNRRVGPAALRFLFRAPTVATPEPSPVTSTTAGGTDAVAEPQRGADGAAANVPARLLAADDTVGDADSVVHGDVVEHDVTLADQANKVLALTIAQTVALVKQPQKVLALTSSQHGCGGEAGAEGSCL